MENKTSMPPANIDPESVSKLFSEDEMRWLQANEILLESSCIPFADAVEDQEPISGVNASNIIPADVSTTTIFGPAEDSLTHPTSEHHHPQTTPVSETLMTEEELPIAETNSYLEQVTNAMGAAVGLPPPSADPHLSSSYKAISPNSLPTSLSRRPSRPKLNTLRVQSATLHPSHIPTPRRSASPKTWHKNRHYHLDGDQDEIDTTKGASEDIESELPDVFSISSPSWLAEPSLNDPESSFDASASTPDMASLISSASMASTSSLNTSAPNTQPPTPTKSTFDRPQLTKTPTSLSLLGERKEWIYRQPKQRTPLPTPTPSLKVSITNTPPSPSPRSPSRTSPPIRPKASPTSPSRLPVRQRKASGLPKPPHHLVGSHTSSSRVLSASSIERKTRVIHVSAETAPSPANLSTSSAGPEASSAVKLNGGVTPVARPIHTVIPARSSLKRQTGEAGSGDGKFGKDIGKDKERQEGSGVMGFWSNLKLRPRGGSLSSLGSSLTSKKAPSPPAIVVEEATESTSTVDEERVETDTRKKSPLRLSLQAPASRRTTSTSSILSQKTLKDVEENKDVTTPTQIPKPITIITTPVESSSSRATAPDSPRLRSSSESSGSSCRSHSTTNTQLSAASSATAPSTAPTTPICSQPSLIPSPKPLGPNSVPMPRPILSRSSSTSSKAPASSLSSKRKSTSVGGKTPSPAKSVTFVDTPTVHYAPEDDVGEDDNEVTPQTDDVFVDKPQSKRSSRWPPLIEGRQGLKLPRGRWQELFADYSNKDVGNTSILEEDEDEESSIAPTESTASLDPKTTLKKLMNFSRNSLEVSPRPSLARNPSSASAKTRPKGGRPSISGPFALGSLPLPNADSPSASTPAAFISGPSSAPSSMLRYQQSSQSSPNRSTTSLRSNTSVRSHTQSLRGSSTSLGSGSTNPRRPHYKSASYSHPPRANGILPFLNADSPASSTISSVSASPSPSPFPAKGSRAQKSPYTVSLHASPSVESFKSTAGRSVRSLGSFKSTMSTGGFRAWLNKVGEGIGISQTQPPVVDEEA